MDYEKKNRQPYTPEQLQAHLAQAWKWAEMALDRYPGEIPGELRSHQITTSGEADQGIDKNSQHYTQKLRDYIYR